MKILLTGDWHLGNQLDAKDYGKGESSRTNEIQNVLLEISDACANVDALVMGGDVFHYSYPPPYLVSLVQDFIKNARTKNPKIQMFFIVGNHDFSSVNMKHALMSLQKTSDMGVTIADQPSNIIMDDVNFIFLPFLGKYFDTTKVTTTIAKMVKKDKKNIMVGHFTPTGATSGSERNLLRESWDFDGDIKGIDMALLGHIHQYQVVGKAIIPGSPIQMDAGEKDDDKGYVVIDTATMTHVFVPIVNNMKYRVMEVDGIPTLEMIKAQPVTKNDIVLLRVKTSRDNPFNMSEIDEYLEKTAGNKRIEVEYTDAIQTRDSTITEKTSPVEALKNKIDKEQPKYAEEIMALGKKTLEEVFHQ